jgi:YidC/Oxa1 family membrane protein insertase
MLWQQWQADYGPKPPEQTAATGGDLVAPAEGKAGDDVPATAGNVAGLSAMKEEGSTAHQIIRVMTDVVKMEVDTRGGDVVSLELLNYPSSKDHPEQPFHLLTSDKAGYFVAQSGFLGDDRLAPNHHSAWQAAATDYRLAEGEKTLRVPLTWTNPEGVTVTKTFILNRGEYRIGLEQAVKNHSAVSWKGRQYVQLQRKDPGDKAKDAMVRTYTGGVIYTTEDNYQKIEFKNMDDNPEKLSKNGWAAMVQHYFMAAWIPHADEENNFYTKALADQHYVIGAYSLPAEVAAGEEKTYTADLFAGPKLQRVLEQTAPGLELTVDYGALTLVAKPIFWLLEQFHKLFDNWGWAIVFVTITLKALFFRLSAASYRSMAGMRKLQPKMQALKEKYGEDKQKLNMAMMELYREEKANPLNGCLPILVQIPVFIALYWVLIETVEMRQAPFIFWLNDLSSKDPYFVLPLLMGISMYFQQKLSPPPSDPMQAKVMQFFPIMFTGFFAFFPSGLVLYWVINNILSMLQQWVITRQVEGAAPAKA